MKEEETPPDESFNMKRCPDDEYTGIATAIRNKASGRHNKYLPVEKSL